MDSENPKRPEGSHDQQGSQPSTSGSGSESAPQGQPMGGYSPPPPPQPSYSQPQQPQYSDRPASQPDQPQYPPQQPYGASPQAPQAPQGDYRPPQYGDQPQPQYPPQQQYGQQQPTQGYQNQQPYYNQPPPPSQVNVAPKKSNNGMLFGLIGLVVVALAAVAIWAFVINKPGTNPLNPGPNPDSGGSVMSAREVSAASALPSNTLGYFSVATNIEGGQKAAFDKIGEAFKAQPGYQETIDKLMQQATGAVGGSSGPANQMVQEIQGLITKYTKQISLAVLPPSTADWQAMMSGGQAAMMDVATRNLVAVADMDLAALKKDATSSEVSETSNGVEISRIVSGTLVLYAAPLGGSNVAVGLRAEPVRILIDQSKNASGSVRETDTYKYLSGSVPGDRVASFYLNLTDLYNQIETVQPGMLAKSGIEGVSGGFLMTVSGQDGGMQLDFATQAEIKSSVMSQAVTIGKPDASTISDVPADSSAFLVSTDLKTLIKSTLDSMSATSKSTGGPDYGAVAEQQVQQATGLSLQNDIIPILGGDYALSGAVGDQTMSTSSVVFQMKMNGGDRDKAANVVDKLMQLAGGSMSGGQIPSFDAAGGKFYDLSGAFGGRSTIGLVAGVSKDRFMVVFAQSGDARAKLDEVSNNIGKGFGAGPKWDTAKNHLPNDSYAIVYVDTENIRQIFASNIPPDAETFLKPFKYIIIGSASASANKGVLRIFFGIDK